MDDLLDQRSSTTNVLARCLRVVSQDGQRLRIHMVVDDREIQADQGFNRLFPVPQQAAVLQMHRIRDLVSLLWRRFNLPSWAEDFHRQRLMMESGSWLRSP